MIYSGGFCQKVDTICVNKTDLVNKLKQVERLKIDSAEKVVFMEQLEEANVIIKNRGELITTLNQQVITYDAITANYKTQYLIMEANIKSLNQSLKTERRRRAWTTGAGAVLVMGLTYLLIVK